MSTLASNTEAKRLFVTFRSVGDIPEAQLDPVPVDLEYYESLNGFGGPP
jgi:hypothetical protein